MFSGGGHTDWGASVLGADPEIWNLNEGGHSSLCRK